MTVCIEKPEHGIPIDTHVVELISQVNSFKAFRKLPYSYGIYLLAIVQENEDSITDNEGGCDSAAHAVLTLAYLRRWISCSPYSHARMFWGHRSSVYPHEHRNCALSSLYILSRKAGDLPFRSVNQKHSSSHSSSRQRSWRCNSTIDDDPGEWAPIDIDALSRQVWLDCLC